MHMCLGREVNGACELVFILSSPANALFHVFPSNLRGDGIESLAVCKVDLEDRKQLRSGAKTLTLNRCKHDRMNTWAKQHSTNQRV